MKRFKLTVAYDGTNYCGWQIQPSAPTIEGELNKALCRLTGETIQMIGASRTDAGVHAYGNVAVFDSDTPIPGEKASFCFKSPPAGRYPHRGFLRSGCRFASEVL